METVCRVGLVTSTISHSRYTQPWRLIPCFGAASILVEVPHMNALLASTNRARWFS